MFSFELEEGNKPCDEGIALSTRPVQPAKYMAMATSIKTARRLGKALTSAILTRSKSPNQIWDLFWNEHKLHTNCQHALGLKSRRTLLHFQLQLLPFSDLSKMRYTVLHHKATKKNRWEVGNKVNACLPPALFSLSLPQLCAKCPDHAREMAMALQVQRVTTGTHF